VTGVQAVQLLLTQCNFYGEVATVLSRLYMGSTVDPSGTNGACGWTVECSSRPHAPPEAGLQPGQWAVVYAGNTDSRSSNEHQGLCVRWYQCFRRTYASSAKQEYKSMGVHKHSALVPALTQRNPVHTQFP
jgi:hypothetical protein